jgi:hypothetical protein
MKHTLLALALTAAGTVSAQQTLNPEGAEQCHTVEYQDLLEA